MASPYDVLSGPTPSKGGSNPYSILSAAPAENPVQHAVGAVGNAAKSVATGLGNVLDAQRFGVAKALTGKDNTDDQRTVERNAVGTQGIYDALGKVPVIGHALQGGSDVLQDTLTDPLTYETLGAGPALKALGLGAKVAGATEGIGKAITSHPLGAVLHDSLNWGGEVTRTQGKSTTNTVRGALNKASTVGAQTAQRYGKESQGIVDSLNDEEKMNVRRGLNGEEATLSPKETKAVTDLRALTERDYADRTKTMLAEKFNEIAPRLSPENKTALAKALRTDARPEGQLGDVYDALHHDVKEAMPYRKDYAPTVHEKAVTTGTEAKPRVAGEQFDTRNMQREQVPTIDANQLGAGFEALSRNAGSMASKRVIHESLGELMDDPAIKKLITDTAKATGDKRTNLQKVGDTWLKVVGYPRAATVSLTPRHAVNILDLAANTVPPQEFPAYMKNVAALTAKLVKATPEEYEALTADGRDLGAISQDFKEHQAFFQNIPVLKHWTAAMNKITWATDVASKQEYAKMIKRMHPEMNDLEAGGQAADRLVDYAHVSPFVKALRYVAPFGTFRGSVPGAVLGGVARNPARAALINRATGGTAYGGKPGKNQHGLEMYNPTADVGRGLDNPQDFVRGTLAQPVQALATMGIEAATGNPGASAQTTIDELRALPGQIMRGQFSKMGTPGKVTPYAKAVALRTARYLNYRHPIDLQFLTDWAASGVPEAQAVIEALGHSQFTPPKGGEADSMGAQALQQSAGVSVR